MSDVKGRLVDKQNSVTNRNYDDRETLIFGEQFHYGRASLGTYYTVDSLEVTETS